MYITDGKTQQIFNITKHYYHENRYKYKKSYENAEIIIYRTRYATINAAES